MAKCNQLTPLPFKRLMIQLSFCCWDLAKQCTVIRTSYLTKLIEWQELDVIFLRRRGDVASGVACLVKIPSGIVHREHCADRDMWHPRSLPRKCRHVTARISVSHKHIHNSGYRRTSDKQLSPCLSWGYSVGLNMSDISWYYGFALLCNDRYC